MCGPGPACGPAMACVNGMCMAAATGATPGDNTQGPNFAGGAAVSGAQSGQWSRLLTPAERFQVVLNGQGVLDKETGLVWDRTLPSSDKQYTLADAILFCSKKLSPRGGWRVPTEAELTSIVDGTQAAPTGTDLKGKAALPPGHPFTLPLPTFGWLWSVTDRGSANEFMTMQIQTGSVGFSTKGATNGQVWCVRGAGGQ